MNSICIITAAVECGQGLLTVLTQIARTELGIREVTFRSPAWRD